MKVYKSRIVITLVLFSSLAAFSFQRSRLSVDYKMNAVLDSLPHMGWTFDLTDSSLVLGCKDSVYRVWGNHINEPHLHGKTISEEERIEMLMKEGRKKERAYFRFKLEKPWGDAQVKKSLAHNQKIYKQIKALPKKYRIEHLFDHFASHKGEASYYPKTENDKKQIAEYEDEKKRLESTLIKFPDYCTLHYSVYLVQKVGMNSQYEDIYPERISKDAYHILDMINEYWDCNKP